MTWCSTDTVRRAVDPFAAAASTLRDLGPLTIAADSDVVAGAVVITGYSAGPESHKRNLLHGSARPGRNGAGEETGEGQTGGEEKHLGKCRNEARTLRTPVRQLRQGVYV